MPVIFTDCYKNTQETNPVDIQTLTRTTAHVGNDYITSVCSETALGSKIEMLAIAKLQQQTNYRTITKKDAIGADYQIFAVTLTAQEIANACSITNTGSYYQSIRKAVVDLKHKILLISNPDNSNEYIARSVFGDIQYACGKLTIEFNPDVQYLFLNLKRNYTTFDLNTIFSFNSLGSLRLYESLKIKAYQIKAPKYKQPQMSLGAVRIVFTLPELRLALGCVNSKELSPALIDKIARKKLANKDLPGKYSRWNMLKKHVIIPAVEKINSSTDLYVDEVKLVRGPHGAIDSVEFYVQPNIKAYKDLPEHDFSKLQNYMNSKSAETKPVDNAPGTESSVIMPSEETQDAVIDEIRLMFPDLSTSECRQIAKAADFDLNVIEEKAVICHNNMHKINNIVGWMIAAIRNDFQDFKANKTVNNYKAMPKKSEVHKTTEETTDYDTKDSEKIDTNNKNTAEMSDIIDDPDSPFADEPSEELLEEAYRCMRKEEHIEQIGDCDDDFDYGGDDFDPFD